MSSAEVRELHARQTVWFEEPWPNGLVDLDYCTVCRNKKGELLRWPCPTIIALDPRDAPGRRP